MCTAEKPDSLLLNWRVFVSVGSAGKLSQPDLDLQHYWGHSNFIWSCGHLITLKIELREMLFEVWGIYVCWKKTWRNYTLYLEIRRKNCLLLFLWESVFHQCVTILTLTQMSSISLPVRGTGGCLSDIAYNAADHRVLRGAGYWIKKLKPKERPTFHFYFGCVQNIPRNGCSG